jgi:glycosyltransferase involved in cell wall biosynthesis
MSSVSVVVPTHNRSELLAVTLRSVLRQRNVELEVIVIDEASTDDTAATVAGFGDLRVRTIRHETPLGVSTARNRGTAEARGDWIAFTDDDDLWAPDKLARQLHAAEMTGRDWAYTGSVNIAEGFRIIHGLPPLPPEQVMATLPRYNTIPGGGSNVVVRRQTLLRAGPFDVHLRNTEDWEMWIRLAKAGPPAWVRSPLMAKRVHSSNSSLDTAEIVRGARLIQELHQTTLDWGRLHRWLAESCLRNGQRGAAIGQMARAALHGQARNVARDVKAIVHRRTHRRSSAAQPARSFDPPWMAEAVGWLRELERVDQEEPR